MNIEKINYQRTFNLGSYESVRIGAEVMVNAGEDAKQALIIAKNFVEEFQKENHPHTYGHDSTPDIPIIPKVEKRRAEIYKDAKLTPDEITVMEMNTCKDLKVLESYKLLVKGKPELEDVYNKIHSYLETIKN